MVMNAPASNPVGRSAWYVCIVLLLCLAFSYMDRTILALLVQPLEHSFHINDSVIGLLQGGTYALFYVAFAFPLGRRADSGNRKWLLIIGVCIWCTATVGSGLAHTVTQLFIGRIIVAVGEAAVMPAGVSMLADYFPPTVRGRAMSVFSIGSYLGAGIGLTAGGTILKHLGTRTLNVPVLGALEPWRVVLTTIGGAGIIMVPLLMTIKEPARREDGGGRAREKMSINQVWQELKVKRFAVMACMTGFALIALGGTTFAAWGPTLFIRLHHYKPGSAGQLFGLLTITLGPLGSLTGGFLSDKLLQRGHTDNKVIVGSCSALAALIGSLMATLNSVPAAIIGIGVMSYFVGFNFGILQAANAELVSSRMRGVATAMYLLMSNFFQAAIGPGLVGLLDNHVFHSDNAIGLSLRLAVPPAFLLAFILLYLDRKHFRRVLATRQADSQANLIANPA